MKKVRLKYNSIYSFLFLILNVACQVANPPVDNQVSKVEEETREAPAELPDSVDTVKVFPEEEIVTQPEYRASSTRLHDLIHTILKVSFDWEKQYLHGVATLELKPYFYPQSTLVLDAKGFDIHEISMIDSSGKTGLDYVYDSLKLTIDLGREYTRDEHYFVEINYTAKPNELDRAGSKAITEDKGLYFINPLGEDPEKPMQIWTQGETEASSCWFPTIDSPNERTTQEMYITVDKKFTTLSNGELIYSQLSGDDTRTDYWKMEHSHAPYLFMMAIGEFAVVEDSWEGLTVNYYVEPEYEKYAKDIFGNTPEMLSFFSEKLDYQFPWSKYSQVVVRDYVSGAMENTTASVYMEALQVDDRELLDKSWDYIIAHETIHQWFGDLVTAESWSNLPLNEAFANYGEYLWNEYKYGVEEADYYGLEEVKSYLQEAETKQVDLIRFNYEHRDDMFDNHSYAKGGRILHMLRKYVGDDAFFKALSYYLKKREFQPVEADHLRLAFEEITGEDMNWFFNQWFFASGHPVLKVEKYYSNGKLQVEVWQNQDLSTTPLYKLPLYIDIWVNGIKTRYAIVIDDSYEVFNFDVVSKPELVVFDGDKQLLGVIEYEKPTEELVYQYRYGDKFLTRYEALKKLATDTTNEAAKAAIVTALDDPFWALRQVAVASVKNNPGDSIAAKLRDLAAHDPKSLVRADAITTLAFIDPENHKDIFITGLEDQAYSVVGASLFAYAQTNASDLREVMEKHESSNNLNIMVPVADYYSQKGIEGKLGWFQNKIDQVSGGALYYMVQYLGQYLMRMPDEVKRKGLAVLEDLARSHETFYIRLAAFQGLGMIDEVEGVRQLMAEIEAEEEDERLREIYSNM